MPFTWDETKRTQLHRLRQEGNSQTAIAKIIGCSNSCIYDEIHRQQKPLSPKPQKARAHAYLTVHHHVASVPMRRHINPEYRNAPQLTKSQMYYDLAMAWRNTVRLSH
jgi:IS30 family transposase